MSNPQSDDDNEIYMECSSPISSASDAEMEEIHDGNDANGEGIGGTIAVRGNLPHQFEPLAPNGANQNRQNQPQQENIYRGRRQNLDLQWCACGQCQVLNHFTDLECRCCMEIKQTKSVAEESKVKCVTQIAHFNQAILDPLTLRLAWETFTTHYRKAARAFNQRGNEKYRYAAYRQFVRLCWGYLGRYIRVYTPACAHALIDNTYPDGQNQYRGTIILQQLPDISDDEDDDDLDSDIEDELLDI